MPKNFQKNKALILLFFRRTGASVSELKEFGRNCGLRQINQWNVSQCLISAEKSGGLAIYRNGKWSITKAGRSYVQSLPALRNRGVESPVVSQLRSHLKSIPDANVRGFLEEAVSAFEYRLFRSAVVLSWVGAVGVLQSRVQEKHLSDFNAEAKKRNANWRSAKNVDEIGRMKESDFLEVLVAIGMLGKNVKDELDGCLKLRNGCAHPNSLKIAEHRVAAHIETLIQNVFAVPLTA